MDEQSESLIQLLRENKIKLDFEFGLNDLWSKEDLVDRVVGIVIPKLEKESYLLSSADYCGSESDFAIIIPVMSSREIGAIPLGISLAKKYGAILALWKEIADYKWVESDITYSKVLKDKSIVLLEDVCRNNFIFERVSTVLEKKGMSPNIREHWIFIDSRETTKADNQSCISVDNTEPHEIIFLQKTDL